VKQHEYLLTCLMEECAEVQKAATKALRFGLDDRGPDEPFTLVSDAEAPAFRRGRSDVLR